MDFPDICASRCAFALLRSEPGASEDNLKAFINTLGNTEVLQRESEAALGDMVRKGAVAKQRMVAQEQQLGRAPTLAEAAAEQARLQNTCRAQRKPACGAASWCRAFHA